MKISLGLRGFRGKRFRGHWLQDWQLFVIAPGATALVLAAGGLGLLQPLELAAVDLFFRARPMEPPDARIVVVTIDEDDIRKAGQWPIPDRLLAKALSNLRAQQPRVIGLDMFRDLPVEPGHQDLVALFKSTPNLIGIQHQLGDKSVASPSVLAQLNQVAEAHIPEDTDKRVRRSLLTVNQDNKVHMSLGLAIALKYLEEDKITPTGVVGLPNAYQLGRARIEPLRPHDGGYVHADTRGYQLLLNFRGSGATFRTISFTDALNNRVPEGWVHDRVVLVGTTAESIKDFFLTPYSDSRSEQTGWTAGVLVHANIISQILSAAIDGRPLLTGFPGSLRWLWTLAGAVTGVLVSWNILYANWLFRQFTSTGAIVGTGLSSGGILIVGYLLFLKGWWVPIVMPILALNLAAIACFAFHSYKLQRLAYFDGLTQVANRRYFDLYLAGQVQKKGCLSLVLCDVDCFKLYNDTYGHQAGDLCLQQVALATQRAVRGSGFVARYGGEEFVVVLPRADAADAALVAEQIVTQVRGMKLPHETSTAASYVTLSCGVATVDIDEKKLDSADWSGSRLVAAADHALYDSKHNGRDRFTLIDYQ
jgi:adenylate cyclase